MAESGMRRPPPVSPSPPLSLLPFPLTLPPPLPLRVGWYGIRDTGYGPHRISETIREDDSFFQRLSSSIFMFFRTYVCQPVPFLVCSICIVILCV